MPMTYSSSRSISGTSPTGCKMQSKHIRWSLRTDRGRPRPTLAPIASFREKRRTTRTRWRERGSCRLRHFREWGLATGRQIRPACEGGRTGTEKEKENRHGIQGLERSAEECWMTQQHSSPAYERKRCRCAKLAARILRGRDSGWATWICLCT